MKAFRSKKREKFDNRPHFDETSLEVKIINDVPPMWNNVTRWLGGQPQNVVFTYGDAIYNPSKILLPIEIVEHEKVHMWQQEFSDERAALWWSKYMRDDQFRLEQELEAYAKQYNVVCRYVTDKNAQTRYLIDTARILSGKLYKLDISFSEAYRMLRKAAYL